MRDLHFAKKWTSWSSSYEAEFFLDFVHWSRARPMLCGIPSSELDILGARGWGLGKFSILKGFFWDVDFEFVF